MAEATFVIGLFNLPLALLEFFKPAAWESTLENAVKSKHLKWAGIFLILLSFFIILYLNFPITFFFLLSLTITSLSKFIINSTEIDNKRTGEFRAIFII